MPCAPHSAPAARRAAGRHSPARQAWQPGRSIRGASPCPARTRPRRWARRRNRRRRWSVDGDHLPFLEHPGRRWPPGCARRRRCSRARHAGLPMPRATTAACEVLPPREVSTPGRRRSRGCPRLVSSRTKIIFSPARPRASAVSHQHDHPRGGAGRGRQPRGQRWPLNDGSSRGTSNCSSTPGTRSNARAVDQSFTFHLDRRAHQGQRVSSCRCASAAPTAAALDRELEVLHLAVVRFELRRQFHQLRVQRRHLLCHRGDRLRRADARHHVFALRVVRYSPKTTRSPVPGLRVKPTPVAESLPCCRTPSCRRWPPCRWHRRRDLELAPVVDRPFAAPRAEHRGNGDLELPVRIIRKRMSGVVRTASRKRCASCCRFSAVRSTSRRAPTSFFSAVISWSNTSSARRAPPCRKSWISRR